MLVLLAVEDVLVREVAVILVDVILVLLAVEDVLVREVEVLESVEELELVKPGK